MMDQEKYEKLDFWAKKPSMGIYIYKEYRISIYIYIIIYII